MKEQPRARLFAIFFVLALGFRLAVAAQTGMFHWMGRSEVEVIALNLLRLGRYDLYDSPTAHAMPLFPLFMTGVFRLFGGGETGQMVNATLACVFSALRCGLVPLFALDAGFSLPVSVVAGSLSVFYVGSVATEVSGKFDGPLVALALLGLLWASLRLWRGGSWQTRTPWLLLAFCGLCALLNPSLLPVIAGLLLAGAIACPPAQRRRYGGQAALAVLTVVVFLIPWAIRNQIALGAPIFTRSNFGLELWVSNGPDSAFDVQDNLGDVSHPSGHAEETARVAELGEVEYNREKLSEAIEWIETNPGGFLRLTAERFVGWWFPPFSRLLIVPKALLTLAAFAGLWWMFRQRRPAAWLILVTWLTFPDIHYLVQWIGRYRTPMDWQILLCASVAFAGVGDLKRRNSSTFPAREGIQ